MKKRSSDKRRSASRAKFFVAALYVALGLGAASAIPFGSTLGESWSFRLESFRLFSTDSSVAEERPTSYLDASGRRVVVDENSVPRPEPAPAFVAETTELLASDVSFDAEPVGATFDETEAEPKLEPVSFANAEDETPDALFTNDAWLVVDESAEARDRWSDELRLAAFPEPTFAETSTPTWRDAVAVEGATLAELRALEFEPELVASSLVSSSLRRRAANARLVSGDYSFAETSNALDANAPQVPSSPSQPTPPQVPSTAPARVGVFTACGTFESNGVAKVRVQ